MAAGQIAGAQRALERVQLGVHARYGGRDLDELREARLAREVSKVNTHAGFYYPTADSTSTTAGQVLVRGYDGPQQSRGRSR